MGRAGAPAVNVLHPEKSRRIDAMDEIKRALEAAEHIPLRNLIVHLGERDERPNYFDVSVFGPSGEACARFLAKGRPIAVDGRLEWHEWTTADGEQRQAVREMASVHGGHASLSRPTRRPTPRRWQDVQPPPAPSTGTGVLHRCSSA